MPARAALCVIGVVSAALAAESVARGDTPGPTGSTAPVLEPLVKEEGLKRVEIDAPGEFLESNVHYVLTKDITAPRDALRFGRPWDKRVANCIIDLNGHTVTYNDEGYTPDFKSVCHGIFVFGTGPVVIRNGTVLQGKGRDAGCDALNLNGALCDVSGLTVKVYGAGCTAIARAGGGKGGRIHDNYIEVHGTSVTRWSGAPAGIALSYAGPDWEVYNNTIVGGHYCIGVQANARPRQDTAARIHHNRLMPRRTPGVKSPHAVFIYTAEKNEIYENLIDAIDARGINVQMGSKDNHVHHNLVAARYTRDARGAGGYDENRCYGYWERSGGKSGNRVTHNIFIVNNATTGDATSSTIGLIVGTGVNYPEPLLTGEYSGNVVLCRHDDRTRPVTGIELKRCGDGVVVSGNRIVARTVGICVEGNSSGVKVSNNTVLRPADSDDAWKALGGDDLARCPMTGNRELRLVKDKDAPAPPAGLEVIERPGAVELRWKRSTEDDLAGYRVWRDGKPVDVPLRGAPFWVDLDVKAGQAYRYAVTAVDLSGNESPPSAPVAVTPADR